MRTVSKLLLAIFLLCLATTANTRPAQAAEAPAGITVSPAALQLGLQKGQQQASTTFSVTNGYKSPVTLSFYMQKPADESRNSTSGRPELAVGNPLITVPAGGTMSQTITLRDTPSLEPGSQQMDLMIAQQGIASDNVGVLPAMRLPVTLIKYDGVVASLGLASIASPRFAMHMPQQVSVSVTNTGNMTAIPRGTVTILDSEGTVLGTGTLNQSSQAVTPGASIQLHTAITPQGHGTLPGNYRITVSYGLGGDSLTQTTVATFIYATWWHIVGIAAAIAAGWSLYKYGQLHRSRIRTPKPIAVKRPTLIGRDIT